MLYVRDNVIFNHLTRSSSVFLVTLEW